MANTTNHKNVAGGLGQTLKNQKKTSALPKAPTAASRQNDVPVVERKLHDNYTPRKP